MDREPIDRTRRKWLRGAAATPAIFTLPTSANPLALASSQCFGRRQGAPAPFSASNADGWVRAKLPLYSLTLTDNTKIDQAVQVGTTWYAYPTGGRIALSVKSFQKLNGQFAYGLVDYTGPGTGPYRYYPEVQPVTPVAGYSCWNSVNPYLKIGADNLYRP